MKEKDDILCIKRWLSRSLMLLLWGCNGTVKPKIIAAAGKDAVSCSSNLPRRFAATGADSIQRAGTVVSHTGMAWIAGGEYSMGASDGEGSPDESPVHTVQLNGFWMDSTEVTNRQFRKFVEATHYVSTAEKAPDWEELKKQLPPGTAKPSADLLVAASLVFTPPSHAVDLHDVSQW